MKQNVYQMVTDKIVEQLEKGIVAWHKPWTGGVSHSVSYVTRKPYSLINQFLLEEPGEYLTFNEIQRLGGKINKGAKAKFVVFYKQMTYTDKVINEETGEEEEKVKRIPLLRYYNVFNVNDTDLPSKSSDGLSGTVATNGKVDDIIMDYVKREGLNFQNDKPSSKAYYSPALDKVVVPMPSQFSEIAEYYSTAFHELVHSTIPERRCNRKTENEKAFFGNEDYSREELVAEIGSAMICTTLGISIEKAFNNSVAYIQNWLQALKNDNKMIVWAASRAEKASDYILYDKKPQNFSE